MKLKIKDFEELAKERYYLDGLELWQDLRGSQDVYELLKNGSPISLSMICQIYNKFGENETNRVIDFEESTLQAVKSKFIEIGDKLYGEEYEDDDDDNITYEDSLTDAELINLFMHEKPSLNEFPAWYFENGCYTISRIDLVKWMKKHCKTWKDVAEELGISEEELRWKSSRHNKWTLMDIICLLEVVGVEDLSDIISFPSEKLRLRVKRIINNY